MSGDAWTKEEKHVLKCLLEKGLKPFEIEPILRNRTRDAITNQMMRMGLHVKPISPDIDWNTLFISGCMSPR